MDHIEALYNKGILTLNEKQYHPSQRTVVVTGLARSGTSIPAGILNKLGIFLGRDSKPPVFEDLYLSTAFENGNDKDFKKIIQQYNSKHMIWGWKRPSTVNNLIKVEKSLQSPYFIIMFRDIFSIANRNRISMGVDLVRNMKTSIIDYEKIIKFIDSSTSPIMLVSMEKIHQHPSYLVNSIINFISLDYNNDQKNNAINFIQKNPDNYLDSSRINKILGYVNLLPSCILKGWAKSTRHANPVDVEIFCDDELIASVIANEYRKHLHGHVHPTGECGFTLDLKPYNIKPNQIIAVRGKGDSGHLRNSPIIFTPE